MAITVVSDNEQLDNSIHIILIGCIASVAYTFKKLNNKQLKHDMAYGQEYIMYSCYGRVRKQKMHVLARVHDYSWYMYTVYNVMY